MIEIKTQNASTTVDFKQDGTLNLEGIPLESRNIIQAAYNAGSFTVIPDPVPIPNSPNWEALTSALAGTPVFGKAVNTNFPNGFTLLMQCLTTPILHDEAHLQYAIQLVRQGLEIDFDADEITFINQLLADNHFLTRIS